MLQIFVFFSGLEFSVEGGTKELREKHVLITGF
jgi:hypothetical protein